MRFLRSFVPSFVLLAAGAAQAASSWTFDDARLTVGTKKAPDSGFKGTFNDRSPIPAPVDFGSTDALKVTLTAKENGKGKRPHQAFLILREQTTGVEAPFPFTVKENGKAIVEIKHADLPLQHMTSTSPLSASLVLASFGSSAGLDKKVFDVEIKVDINVAPVVYEKPLRYGKKEEIHHIFRDDPKSPPVIISSFFVLAILAVIPALFVGWLALGANAAHLSKAMSDAPIAHTVFFGSIAALEGVFYLYYSSWNLFQTLPVIGLLGTATFLSGTKALGEVQSRRLAGER